MTTENTTITNPWDSYTGDEYRNAVYQQNRSKMASALSTAYESAKQANPSLTQDDFIKQWNEERKKDYDFSSKMDRTNAGTEAEDYVSDYNKHMGLFNGELNAVGEGENSIRDDATMHRYAGLSANGDEIINGVNFGEIDGLDLSNYSVNGRGELVLKDSTVRNPQDYNSQKKFKRSPWSEWMRMGLQSIANTGSINRKYGLEASKQVPLYTPTYQQSKITNNYQGQTAMSNIAANLRSRLNSASNQSSDMTTNYAQQLAIEDYANQYAEKAQALKTQEYNTSLENAQNIANANDVMSANTADKNKYQLAALHNQILDAKQKKEVELNANFNSTLNNLAASYGKWLQSNRYAKAKWDQNQLQNRFQEEYENADWYKDYVKLLNDENSLYNSKSFTNLITDINNHKYDDQLGNAEINFISEDGTINQEALKAYLQNHPDDELSRTLQKNYNDEYKRIAELYNLNIQKLQQKYRNLSTQSSPIISNQGIFSSGDHRVSPLWSKQGGTITSYDRAKDRANKRFIAYLNNNRKEKESVMKNLQIANKSIQDKLARDLGALDRETILLLQKAFK